MTNTEFTNRILADAKKHFTFEQLTVLEGILILQTRNIRIEESEGEKHELVTADQNGGKGYAMFFIAKKIEGLSKKTLRFYKLEIDAFVSETCKPLDAITADDIRIYLARRSGKVTNVTLDNKRRILSTFFEFLSAEDYIVRNPMKKIRPIRQARKIKLPFSEIEIEQLRDACETKRETAVIDLFLSTGMRVGELHLLDLKDVDFSAGEAVVLGKGNKERTVYLNAKATKHLRDYLDSRKDDNEALIVSEQSPHARLKISGIEVCVREIGKRAGVKNVHPHRFRRTAATSALARGMPIEQVQKMLGHEQTETTLRYAVIASDALKASHRKYM
ncbi:MAG: tyrosine-type recombinase/integrase [Clostridiales Family XIII bacterium]|jgi:integrase/recombinase XerD|nr:tyrosine-type recombinase/integrase [Clostridiales Family XIII bacterium]